MIPLRIPIRCFASCSIALASLHCLAKRFIKSTVTDLMFSFLEKIWATRRQKKNEFALIDQGSATSFFSVGRRSGKLSKTLL